MKATHATRRRPVRSSGVSFHVVHGESLDGLALELVVQQPIRLADVGRVALVLLVGIPMGVILAAILTGLALLVFGVPT